MQFRIDGCSQIQQEDEVDKDEARLFETLAPLIVLL